VIHDVMGDAAHEELDRPGPRRLALGAVGADGVEVGHMAPATTLRFLPISRIARSTLVIGGQPTPLNFCPIVRSIVTESLSGFVVGSVSGLSRWSSSHQEAGHLRQFVDEFVLPPPLHAQRNEQADDLSHVMRWQVGARTLPGPVRGMHPASYGQMRGLMALQRAAGNRAVAQLIRGSSPAPSVQRCGPGGCGPGGCANADSKEGEEAPTAAQGVEGGQEEEFPTPAQGVVQRAIADPARQGTVQRVATFADGPVHEVNNLAGVVVNGTEAGVTWPSLNGTQFWSTADALAALVLPTVTTTAVAAGGFDAQVDPVPTNTGSYDETVLAAGPWTLVTPQATIAGMFPALAMCTGAGDTTFRARGNPSDAAMFAANRRHENHHARDHRAAFRATIVPWDRRLTRAQARGRTFHGATTAAAEAALWAAMGGTPNQIADAFMNRLAAAVVAYHGSPSGGPIGAPTRPGADATCDNSWARYRNPS
jgi:hypothetical protein